MRKRHKEIKQTVAWTQEVWRQSLHSQPIRNGKSICQEKKQPVLAMLCHYETELFCLTSIHLPLKLNYISHF